jgi:hypothetical protein
MDLQTPTPPSEPRKKTSQVPLPELPPPNKASVANQTCWYVGAIILAISLVGFVVPGLFALHLNPVHNLILMVSGVLAIWFGLTSPDYTAKRFCRWFGGVYLAFGLAGFAFGHRALSLTRPTSTGLPEESSFLWRLVPGHFEIGTADHVLHIIIGAIFLTAAFFTLRRKHKEKITWH